MKISVITPVYNRADCIAACMESVSGQLPCACEIEHIVVDDGSSDSTGDIVADYAQAHSHVKLIRFDKNRGTNAGRNAAVAAATGDYVMILDSDDEMLPGAIASVAQAIAGNEDFSYFMFVCDDRAAENAHFCAEHTFILQDFIQGMVSGDFVHVIPRRIISELPFDESLRIYEGAFFMRFYRAAGKVKFINKTIYHRNRDRADHVTFSMHRTDKNVLRKVCRSNSLFYDWFKDEYMASAKGRQRLIAILQDSHRNFILLGDYAQASKIADQLKQIDAKPSKLMKLLAATHTGALAWVAGRQMMKFKHRISRLQH